jgi:carbohydrate-selective porin OprB
MLLVGLQASAAQPVPPASEAVYPDLLEGTLSAGGDLEDDEQTRTGFLRRPTALEPWFAWKQRIRQEHGFGFGGSWGVLWQSYSSTPIDEKNAVGSKLALNFSYDLWNRNMPDALTFAMAIEDRRPLGTDLPPLFAGLGAGSIVPTAATWSEFDLGITQAYIRQSLFKNRFQYTIGKIFAPTFVNPYPFFDGNRQFLNQQFSSSPTIALPLRGFGMVAAWYPGASGFYVKPGMFTPYSDDTGSTISDFFNRNEYFYMLEAGFSGLAQSGTPINARGAMDVDNIHLTAWYRDALPDGTPRAYGFAFNVNQRIGTDLMWYLRAGWSEGWQADRAWSAGFGWRPASAPSDLFGVGVGSTHPTSPFLRTQTTAELFYRFHVTPNLAITPDVQAIFDPSLNPDKDTLWVFSLRARVVF